uniref:Helicase-associated domain-containing protein n=1 Tax=Anopheles culicifacies TaxID=139723 RepID=A0A182M8Q6_9DIPT
MDERELAALRKVAEFVANSECILEVKIVSEIDQLALKALEQELAFDQRLRTIWFLPAENDVGVSIVRAESGGEVQLSVATELQLKDVEKIAKQCKSDGFANRTNDKRFVSPMNWNFWFIGKKRLRRIPPKSVYNTATLRRRKKLPAYRFFANFDVWSSVEEPKVFIVHGRADSGKRTEIVHYMLENAHKNNHSCRMLYVMQEEVEILATAVHICEERDEPIGETIGYKLNINAQVGEMNNVVFCTTQTLIFSMLGSSFREVVGKLSHLIVDCGDRALGDMDLVLSLVKKVLNNCAAMKLVLLSSRDENPSPFEEFFGGAQVLRIPCGKPSVNGNPNEPHGVEYFYLDSILENICTHQPIQIMKGQLPTIDNALKLVADLQLKHSSNTHNQNVTNIMDMLLERCWLVDDVTPFTAVLLQFLEYNKHMVDYQHSETRMNALMIACAKGFVDVVESLLVMGANPYLVGRRSLQAMDWCSEGRNNPCWQKMNDAYQAYTDKDARKSLLCQTYHKMYNPFVVDQKLVVQIVQHICANFAPGKILVMMPDFCDILECYDLLRRCKFGRRKTIQFVICNRMLTEHELIESLLVPTSGSSNLYVVLLVAQTLLESVMSLTSIDYVVDTGLVAHPTGDFAKGICFDRSCLATPQRSRFLMWLAQRKCFMLYTKDYLNDEPVKPLIKAAGNMVALDTVLKALSCRTDSDGLPALEYLLSTLFSSCPIGIATSLQTLLQIGAIETPLNLPTSLGFLLVHLGIDIHLGKALLYSILFRCLDPVITIVAALTVGDPFIEPLNQAEEKEIMQLKVSLHHRTYSDCMVLLRLYQNWSQWKMEGIDRKMVQSHRLKPGAMEAISNVRVELMSLLRLLGIVKCGREQNTDKLNLNAGNWHMVKGCLAAGFYPQVAMANYQQKQLTANCGTETFKPHPQSVAQVDNLPTKWVIYHKKQDHKLKVPQDGQKVQAQLIHNTVISDVTFMLMCGIDRIDSLSTGNMLTRNCSTGKEPVDFVIDRKYLFQLPREMFDAVLFIRRNLGQLFKDFTHNLLKTMESKESQVLIKYIGNVLHAEDRSLMASSLHVDTRPKIKNLLPMGVFWNYTFDMFTLP